MKLNFNCNYFIITAIVVVIPLLCQSCCSQNSTPAPPQTVQHVQNSESSEEGGGAAVRRWLKSLDPNYYLNYTDFLENEVSLELQDLFESVEEFEAAAHATLFTGVSEECELDSKQVLSHLLWSLSNKKMERPAAWALQMVDAWGKFPAGLFSGHTAIPGDFLECLQIRGNYSSSDLIPDRKFKGKYCATYILPVSELPQNLTEGSGSEGESEKDASGMKETRIVLSPVNLIKYSFGANGGKVVLFLFVGTCFPSSCSKADAQTIFSNFYEATTRGTFTQAIVECYTDEKPPMDAADITVVILLSTIGFLCLAGSVFDVAVYRRKGDAVDDSLLVKCGLAFSVPRNTEKLLNTTSVGSDNFGCLHGLRFLSIAWVILGHTWCMALYQLTWNLIDVKSVFHDWTLMPIINATVAVDSFFLLSGTLMSYYLLKEFDRTDGRLNYPLLVLHRFLRITPTYMMLLAVIATILPYFGFGPQWYVMDAQAEMCRKYWWYNALFINNFVDETKTCYRESWYLAADTQFFLIAPLIIYPLWRCRKIGLAILGALSITSIVVPAVIQHVQLLPPTLIPFIALTRQRAFFRNLYYAPWSRMGPYLVGIFLGFVLHYRSQNPNRLRTIPWFWIVIGWTLSTVVALLIVFGIRDMYEPGNEVATVTSVRGALYAGFHRFCWGLVIAWIIFACVGGYGGFVNEFLSWKIFVPLGRITFCVYLSSARLQSFYHLKETHPAHWGTYGNTTLFCAHLLMACLLGYFLTVTLESPVIQLEKLLLVAHRPPPQLKTGLPTNDDNVKENIKS